MLIEDGRIAAIGSGTPDATADETLDVAGAFVAPGFVSSHSHLFTSGLRGLGVADLRSASSRLRCTRGRRCRRGS
jgi:5-methylthioadenosine/S-adenosylhomocysteine deaminase